MGAGPFDCRITEYTVPNFIFCPGLAYFLFSIFFLPFLPLHSHTTTMRRIRFSQCLLSHFIPMAVHKEVSLSDPCPYYLHCKYVESFSTQVLCTVSLAAPKLPNPLLLYLFPSSTMACTHAVAHRQRHTSPCSRPSDSLSCRVGPMAGSAGGGGRHGRATTFLAFHLPLRIMSLLSFPFLFLISSLFLFSFTSFLIQHWSVRFSVCLSFLLTCR